MNSSKLHEAFALCHAILDDRSTFDRNERDYKLHIARRIQDLTPPPATDQELLRLIRRAFRHPQQNLTDHRASGAFLKWVEQHPTESRSLIRRLSRTSISPPDRVHHFMRTVPPDALSTPGNRISIAAFFLMGFEPHRLPMIRVTPFRTVERILEWDLRGAEPASGAPEASIYAFHLQFAEWFGGELQHAHLPIFDMMDVQSLIWVLATNGARSFRSWRGETHVPPPPPDDDPLPGLVDEFKASVGYPRASDEKHWAAREEFSDSLTPQALLAPDWSAFRRIFSSGHYGSPGPQPGLNRYITNADDAALEHLRRAIEHLLYGDDPPEERLDALLSGSYKIPNFGEAVAVKLLAIVYPERFLPVFPYADRNGKAVLMQPPELRLDPLPAGTRGTLAVQSNDALYQRLDPFFPDDPWGMGQFLYWLRDRTPHPTTDPLAVLAAELLLPEPWLREAIELLREKRQIIFYGPPGTGKTFIARKLMAHLAPDSDRREIVQFHPSYSYEDFVQGYRPEVGEHGALGYRLQSGPLIRLAERAAASPTEHVLLIDEINRGNLPKILGELLYLLEYRDDDVALLYGDEHSRFSFPENLLIIGTMNTADRSIGLVDAALRRRFHFIPLFPAEPPLAGFLERWLDRHHPELLWLAPTIDLLNATLREKIGPHLQIGHSYFVKPGLTEAGIERIWKYDVMPLLEDQLFGHEIDLGQFALHALRDNLPGADASPHPPGAEPPAGQPDAGGSPPAA